MLEILSIDHIGVRVHDYERSLEFYEKLGFRLEIDHGDNRAYEIINEQGVRINLIVNASSDSGMENILLDHDIKFTGYTHPAFIVSSLEDLINSDLFKTLTVTEGPNEVERRRYLFIRDPDGNVLEFVELLN